MDIYKSFSFHILMGIIFSIEISRNSQTLRKTLNADGLTELWTIRLKLTVTYFADQLNWSWKSKESFENIILLWQHWCQVTTHIHRVHCQTHLFCIMIDTNSIFTLIVKHFQFHLCIFWYPLLLRHYYFPPDNSNLLPATERTVRWWVKCA